MRKFVPIVFGFFFLFISSPIAQKSKIEPYSHKDFDESFCVRAMPEPILLPISPDFPPPTIEWVPHRRLKETVQLTPEVIVEVEQGGCEHAFILIRYFIEAKNLQKTTLITWGDISNYLEMIKLVYPWDDFPKTLVEELIEKDFDHPAKPKEVFPTETIFYSFKYIPSSTSQVAFEVMFVQYL